MQLAATNSPADVSFSGASQLSAIASKAVLSTASPINATPRNRAQIAS